MKLAIVGCRTFTDYNFLENEIFTEKYSKYKTIYKAEWDLYREKAGYIRNKLIIDNCDKCIAF